MKLTEKQLQVIEAIHSNAIKQDDKGYYFLVPAFKRRSSKLRITKKTIDKLTTLGLWIK